MRSRAAADQSDALGFLLEWFAEAASLRSVASTLLASGAPRDQTDDAVLELLSHVMPEDEKHQQHCDTSLRYS